MDVIKLIPAGTAVEFSRLLRFVYTSTNPESGNESYWLPAPVIGKRIRLIGERIRLIGERIRLIGERIRLIVISGVILARPDTGKAIRDFMRDCVYKMISEVKNYKEIGLFVPGMRLYGEVAEK